MRKICCQIAVKTRNNPNTNQPKPLLASLELYWGASKMFGMPKGDSLELVCWRLLVLSTCFFPGFVVYHGM
jgi:hypothetical protein